jgi:FixJ family two-component response regulator
VSEEGPIVAVIDDDEAVREAVDDLLRSVGLRMQGYASAAEYQARKRSDAPSCIVLDVRLPGASGLEIQRDLQEAGDDTPIIFITGHGDIPMSVQAMKAGALEFLTKPFRDQDLLDAIQRAISRDAERRLQRVTIADLRARLESLTAREREVMAFLAAGQPNKQIGAAIGATESTVKTHRTQIMRKMGASSVAELVRMADKLGVVLP